MRGEGSLRWGAFFGKSRTTGGTAISKAPIPWIHVLSVLTRRRHEGQLAVGRQFGYASHPARHAALKA